jgi:hypothetical protein
LRADSNAKESRSFSEKDGAESAESACYSRCDKRVWLIWPEIWTWYKELENSTRKTQTLRIKSEPFF